MVPSTTVFVWSLQCCQQKMDGGWLIICLAVINTLRSHKCCWKAWLSLTIYHSVYGRPWTLHPFRTICPECPTSTKKKKKKVLICFSRLKNLFKSSSEISGCTVMSNALTLQWLKIIWTEKILITAWACPLMMKISQSGGNNEIHNKPEERCVRREPWPRDPLINAEACVCVRSGGTWG